MRGKELLGKKTYDYDLVPLHNHDYGLYENRQNENNCELENCQFPLLQYPLIVMIFQLTKCTFERKSDDEDVDSGPRHSRVLPSFCPLRL